MQGIIFVMVIATTFLNGALLMLSYLTKKRLDALTDMIMTTPIDIKLSEEQKKILDDITSESKKEIPEGDDLADWENVEVLITTQDPDDGNLN